MFLLILGMLLVMFWRWVYDFVIFGVGILFWILGIWLYFMILGIMIDVDLFSDEMIRFWVCLLSMLVIFE